MVSTCHVTGVVISPDGDPVPRATVRFQRLPHEVFVEDDKTGIPREVRAEADEEGNIAVDLIPGEYKAIIIARGYNQYPAFNVGVPDQPTAVLADIQDVPPPPSLDDAERAVRDARDYRDEAGNYASAASDSAQAAQTAEQSAQGHAQAAADSAQAAASSAQAAATSEQNAATSEGNASGYATAAGNSASAAATSEQNAANSASAAAGSASAASTSANNAADAQQAAEAAAQTATEKAGEAADSAQNAADAALAIPSLLIGPSVMARYNPSRLVVYDNCARDVSEDTDAHGLQTPSGHTWEAVARDTGEDGIVNPILRYTPDGVLFASRDSFSPSPGSAATCPFSLISDTPWHEYKTVFAKYTNMHTTAWWRGIILNWIDEDNFLALISRTEVFRLVAFSDGIETQIGQFGSYGSANNANYFMVDVAASIKQVHPNYALSERAVSVRTAFHVEHFPIPEEFAYLVNTPGKIGLFANRNTDFLAFGMEAS